MTYPIIALISTVLTSVLELFVLYHAVNDYKPRKKYVKFYAWLAWVGYLIHCLTRTFEQIDKVYAL